MKTAKKKAKTTIGKKKKKPKKIKTTQSKALKKTTTKKSIVKKIRPRKARTQKHQILNFSVHLKSIQRYWKTCWKAWWKTWSSPSFSKLVWFAPTAIVLILLIGGILVKTTPSHPINNAPKKLTKLYKDVQNLSTSEKVVFWSEKLLAKPELLSDLSPGPKIQDTAPVFPPSYDCTTFVETVGGLARSQDAQRLADSIISIRYHYGRTTYLNRNHFPEADWVPNNERAGILKDITVSVAGRAGIVASWAHKEIDKLAWFKSQDAKLDSRALASVSIHDGKVDVELPYIPTSKLKKMTAHIPQGAIINFVREDRKDKPVLISHQGFLIWKGGKPYFRHASAKKQITEVPFFTYVRSMNQGRWKLLGLNINQFN